MSNNNQIPINQQLVLDYIEYLEDYNSDINKFAKSNGLDSKEAKTYISIAKKSFNRKN